MSDEASAPGSEGAAAPVATPAVELPAELSVHDAARALSEARWKRSQPAAKPSQNQAPAPEQEAAVEQPELPEEGNADPEADPGEAPEAADPEATPPIEPPRSWTKDAKERWNALPPETQAYLAEREQQRDREVRRSQNEAAEATKRIAAQQQELEKARKDYEAKLPALMQALQDAQSGAFSDIKTVDDVTRLATEDPFRYLQWQAHQQKLQAVNYEMEQAKTRQTGEQRNAWATHVQAENAKVVELHPELADPKAVEKWQKAAVDLLEDKGFTKDELNRLASGNDKLSIFDHRIQSLLIDGVKYRQAQSAPAKVVPPTVPKVERPGTAKPQGSTAQERVQALQKQFDASPTVDNATALRLAQLQVRKRA